MMKDERFAMKAPVWIQDRSVSMCMVCAMPFKLMFRRHHCRGCGKVCVCACVCGVCTCHAVKVYLLRCMCVRVLVLVRVCVYICMNIHTRIRTCSGKVGTNIVIQAKLPKCSEIFIM